MSWLVTPSTGTNRVVDLANSIELIRVLSLLKAEYTGAKNRSAIELLNWLLEDPKSHQDSIGAAISNITKIPVTEIMATWAELKKTYDSPQIQRLLLLSRSLDQLNNDSLGLEKHFSWTPTKRDISSSIAPIDATTLSIGASLKASFEFEALPATPSLPRDVSVSLNSELLVRMSFEGSLGLSSKIGIKTPAGGGMLQGELNTSASGNIDAELYFLENSDTLFGVALAENLATLFNNKGAAIPFSAEGLARLIEKEGLYCLKFQAIGQLGFSGNVAFGQTVEVGNQVKASIGASLGYRLTKKGAFDYLLARHNVDGEPTIAVQIKRSNTRETLQSQSVGIELDAREVAKRLAPLVEDKLGKAEAALKEFQAFLPSSDFLSQELEQLIQEQFSKQPILGNMLRSLVGIDPQKTPEMVLRDLIIGKIETSSMAWSETIEQAISSIVQDIFSSLPPEIINAAGLKKIIETTVSAALDKRRSALLDEVTRKITDTDAYKKLASKLNEAGANISKTVSKIETGIDQATAAIRTQLSRIQEVISDMRAHLEAITTKTINLRIASEKIDKYEDSLNLRFDVFPHRPGAEDVLSAILCGEMNQVMTLINQQGDYPAVIARSGDFTTYQNHKQTQNTDLILWNFKLGSQNILEQSVKWQVGVDGNITAMSQTSFNKINDSLKKRDTVRFVDNADLIFSKKKSTVSIGITVSHEDESLSESEIMGFFSGMVSRNLLPQLVADKAITNFRAQSAKNARKGRLDVGLTLTQKHLERMFALVEVMADPVRCNEVDQACRYLPQYQGKNLKPGAAWVLNTVSEIQADILEHLGTEKEKIARLRNIAALMGVSGISEAIRIMTPGLLQELWGQYDRDRARLPSYDYVGTGYQRDLSLLEYRRYGAMALYEILCRMKALADIPMSLSAQPEVIQDFTIEALNTQQQRIGDLMPVWWNWGGEWKHFLMLTDEMRPSTLSLLESWVKLAKGPDGEGESPVLWASISLDNGNGKLSPVLLT